MNRRLFFGTLLGAGAATSVQVDAERQPEPIREGDVLVLEYPGHLSFDGIRNIQEGVAAVLPDVKLLIVEEGMTVKLLRPEAVRSLLEES